MKQKNKNKIANEHTSTRTCRASFQTPPLDGKRNGATKKSTELTALPVSKWKQSSELLSTTVTPTQEIPHKRSHNVWGKPPGLKELNRLTRRYYDEFSPFFRDKPEGSITGHVTLELSSRMAQKLGLSYLFERIIRLNTKYFTNNPNLLPYTLFHEMTHLWLYDCDLDPNHTRRFYKKMEEFNVTGLPVDPRVHIHSRIAKEANFVYSCPNCHNRWYLRRKLTYPIYCGLCYDRNGVEHYAYLRQQHSR